MLSNTRPFSLLGWPRFFQYDASDLSDRLERDNQFGAADSLLSVSFERVRKYFCGLLHHPRRHSTVSASRSSKTPLAGLTFKSYAELKST